MIKIIGMNVMNQHIKAIYIYFECISILTMFIFANLYILDNVSDNTRVISCILVGILTIVSITSISKIIRSYYASKH